MPQAKILVLDDSPTSMKPATSCLELQGCHLITAVDSAEPLPKASREQPNLIVLDVMSPSQNGFQSRHRLQASDHTKNIPVIMLTGRNQNSEKFWRRQQDANAYLTKPVTKTELLSTVTQYL